MVLPHDTVPPPVLRAGPLCHRRSYWGTWENLHFGGTVEVSHTHTHTHTHTCLDTCLYNHSMGFPGGAVVKNLSADAEDPSLIPGSGRSPEEGLATRSSVPAWRVPWTEEPGGVLWGHSLWGQEELDTTEHTMNESLNKGNFLKFSPSLSPRVNKHSFQPPSMTPAWSSLNLGWAQGQMAEGNHLQGSPLGPPPTQPDHTASSTLFCASV